MLSYEIVVTDVTCYGNLYCVAGWDPGRGHMVRPEPPGANAAEASKFWDEERAGVGRIFSAGNVVRFAAMPPPSNFPFPHATEDRILVKESIKFVREIKEPEMIVRWQGADPRH